MSAHTPGPWDDCAPGDYSDFNGHSIVILSAVSHRVAVVQGDDKEAIANARLIAAAPGLLEALKAIIEEQDQNEGYCTCKTYDAARAAIAKAEGKA